jgi:amino acid adenylation domain-containing protein
VSEQENLSTRRSKLSPAKQALLKTRLRGELVDRRESKLISRLPERDRVPLSFAQERLWFLDQLEPGNPAYNRPVALRLIGSLDVGALERALSEVLRRHGVLRATFSSEDGRPTQTIAPTEPLSLPVVDLGELSSTGRESQARRLAIEEAQRPFDLSQSPLLRATLLRLDSEEHILLLVIHHIAFDGWSASVLTEEIAALYEAFSTGKPSPLPELPVQYADFAHWQREWLQGEVLEAQLSYWRERLADAPPLLDLPTDHPRPAIQTYRGACESLTLPPYLVEPLRALSQREGVTLFMTLLGAFQVLLHRYTAQDDIVVGSPVAGRTRIETEGLIGFFINTLVLRTDLSGDPTFRELLGRVREVALGGYAHQDLPFEKLVEELQPERDLSHTPLFQVMLNLENIPAEDVETASLRIEEFEFDSGVAQFDLALEIVTRGEGLFCSLKYNADLFDEGTIERMLGHYQTLLQGIVADPNRRLSELPLLMESERHQMLVTWNDTRAEYPKGVCVHQLFEAQVERTPDAVAVVFENQRLTYRELNERANQLAHYLRALGVGPDVLVGICVERSLEMMVGVLGILKAGGAYMPLDPADPKERVGFMLEDTQAAVLLTQSHLLDRLPEHQAHMVCLDADWEVVRQSRTVGISEVTPESLVYVIYTSGSTGQPKGVMVEHRGLVNYLCWINEGLLSEGVTLPVVTKLTFDASLKQLLAPLLRGDVVWVVRDDVVADPVALLEVLSTRTKVGLNCTPSLWQVILDTVESSESVTLPGGLSHLLVGGEQLSEALVDRTLTQAPDLGLWNLYGPTETTVIATFARIVSSDRVTIGRPTANTHVYILDRHLQPVPVGVVGELHVGGDGVARGYLNRPELTSERFIPDPFVDEAGARLYKTGDLCRYLSDGNIEFLGRIDYQVKIRGFRIELGEIEAVLGQHPAVRETVVVAREETPDDPSTSLRTGRRLAAYVVPEQGRVPTASELRHYLRGKLPEYMVPGAFVTLEALPLTSTGKVDRRSLPAPDQGRPAQEERAFIAPWDTLEFRLVQIWEQVLDVHPIGVRDNFFDLGGHSLLAVRLFAEIEKEAGRRLPLSTLFQAPTVKQLASILRREGSPGLWRPLVPIKPEGSNLPFFCVHPLPGDVLCFTDLARHLGPEQPFYALQARGLDGVTPPQDRVEDTAALYLEEIRTVQPEGPYFLGGYCTGGTIAFEMAQQLQAQGQQVALLALIETSLLPELDPGVGLPVGRVRACMNKIRELELDRKLARVLRWAGRIRQGITAEIKYRLRRRRRNAKRRAGGIIDESGHGVRLSASQAAQIRRMMRDARREVAESSDEVGFEMASLVLQAMQVRKAVEAATLHGRRNYKPQIYQGKITVFRTRRRRLLSPDRCLDWARLATGGLERHRVPGDDVTMMKEPHVQVLAAKLRNCLRKARSGG